MSVPTDAPFEIPEEGNNEGARPQDADQGEAYVDESNVPHPKKGDEASEQA